MFIDFGPNEFTDNKDWLGLVQNEPEPFEFLGTDEESLIVSEIRQGTVYNVDEP